MRALSAGELLGVSASLATLLSGGAPDGLEGEALAAYRDAIGELEAAGVARSELAGLAGFRTGRPAVAYSGWVLASSTMGVLIAGRSVDGWMLNATGEAE